MARTGSALVIALIASASAFAEEPSITMQADRDRVGTEDTFRVEIVVANAPGNSTLSLPASDDFEVLGNAQSSQMSYSVGPGGVGAVTHVQKHTLTLRANRSGKLTIPPAVLRTPGGNFTTRAVKIEVVPGRLQVERNTRRPPPNANPFGLPPGFGGLDEEGDLGDLLGDLDVPTGDSDLFLRTSLDKSEAFIGEQVMLTIHLYSRVDLSTVDSVTMPKLDGFLSQDFKTPTNLMSEQRVIGGVPYREYLLRQKAVFPLKAGPVVIEPVEADITTGLIFAGRKVHKKGNELKLVVRPLPPGPATSIVGRFTLSREVSQTEVTLGEPVQVKLILNGRGSLQAITLPPLNAPSAFKTFDPEITDKAANNRAQVGGTRTLEYTLVPQQTGTFELPAIVASSFDPEGRKYTELRVDPITITVKPGADGAKVGPSIGTPLTDLGPKNQLIGGGLKSLRHTARFSTPKSELSAQRWFLPVALAPLILSLLAGAFLFVRNSVGPESADSVKRKQARAARKRLAAAEKLLSGGSTGDFYAEVERALTSFMSARLGTPVTGLVRTDLVTKLTEAGIAELERQRIIQVLETCDTGRYAPGMGEASARKRALDDAAAAMEGWS